MMMMIMILRHHDIPLHLAAFSSIEAFNLLDCRRISFSIDKDLILYVAEIEERDGSFGLLCLWTQQGKKGLKQTVVVVTATVFP
ncbi:hypothetical protein LINPERPRIM_LOCUS5698 [Linum perenne]